MSPDSIRTIVAPGYRGTNMRWLPAVVGVALVLLGATSAEAQQQSEIARLAALGKVWGFLKYFHPGVAAGSVNWDSVLVAAVPKVRAVRKDAESNAIVQALLDAAGPVRPCMEVTKKPAGVESRCARVFPDSMRINLDLHWLTETKTFSSDISRRLEQIRDNRHQGSGRYVTVSGTATFGSDTAFASPEYPSEGQRLLALFRYWNAVRYYFPYMYVNGGDWTAVLTDFIPRMIAAKNAAEYHLAALEMTARLHDMHGSTNSAQLLRTLGARPAPFEPRTIDAQLVVWKLFPGAPADGSGLQVGDVVTHVDGEAVSQRRRYFTRYVAAGNPSGFERRINAFVLRGHADSATYTIERDGNVLTRRVAMGAATGTPQRVYPVSEVAKVLPNSNIGYVNMGDITVEQVDSALAIVKNTVGIVMDVRNYPRGTMYRFADFFNPDARPFAKFTSVDSTYPGQVVWRKPVLAGRANGNSNYYRGRVAILVDERTQSHAEFSVMALRTAPENRVIGSQTAGADGNVTTMTLPGGLRTTFTGLGVYYPDGKATQRVGIVPDIEIRPTLKGLRAGRDEVLERALEYLRTGR